MRSSLIVLCMLFCLSIKASDESDGLVVKSFDKFTFNSYNDVDIKRIYDKQKNRFENFTIYDSKVPCDLRVFVFYSSEDLSPDKFACVTLISDYPDKQKTDYYNYRTTDNLALNIFSKFLDSFREHEYQCCYDEIEKYLKIWYNEMVKYIDKCKKGERSYYHHRVSLYKLGLAFRVTNKL